MVGTVFFHVLIIEELPIWHGFHGEHFLVRSLRFHAAFCRDNQQPPYLTQMLTLPLKRFHYGDFPKFSGCSWYSVRSLESQEMCLSISWTNCVFWLIFFQWNSFIINNLCFYHGFTAIFDKILNIFMFGITKRSFLILLKSISAMFDRILNTEKYDHKSKY